MGTTSSDQNLTPEQRVMPRAVKKEAFKRIPTTCRAVRSIMDQVKKDVMMALDVPAHDEATVDAVVSVAFQRIRDEVAHPFRTEQMKLLKEIGVGKENDASAAQE